VTDFFGLNVRLQTLVTDMKKDNGIFHISLQEGDTIRSKSVIVATGDFDNPNKLGIPGEDLPKVTNYYREGHLYYKMNVVVVGASNSGVETTLDIHRSGGKVTLVHRGEWLDEHVKAWVVPDIENRIGFGEITAHFNSRLTRIDKRTVTITDKDGNDTVIKNDAVVLQIGYHPDFFLLKKAGVRIEGEKSVPVHNQETLETNIHNLYIAGCLTVGTESNRIFIHNGRFHGGKIISAIEKTLIK
ncbi:NAD(P)-binding domain-containing protein, partial [candidate division KSB1 bacterium]|nr:NAD(P)-binding domain-containing protein [candidate division KSB1 bacterium]